MPDDLVGVVREPLPHARVRPVAFGVVHPRHVGCELLGVDEHQHILHARTLPSMLALSSKTTGSGPDTTPAPHNLGGRGPWRTGSLADGRRSGDLAQRTERCADLVREDARLLPGGEVTASVGLVEVGEVGV